MATRFIDRADAARQLATALSRYRGSHPLVLAIPRGGVPLGRILADALEGDLDIVLVRKLGAPFNPELAIGAVDEQGRVHLEPHAREARANAAFVRQEASRELRVIRERRKQYSQGHAPIDPAGRTVIVVDDGLATGATMRAALSAIRSMKPDRLVCAVPVAAPESLEAVEDLCDDVACLEAPPEFHAVGQFYDRFTPVSESEVVALLSTPAAASPVPRVSRRIRIAAGDGDIEGDLEIPSRAAGLVIFAHGSGSGRMSPRNRLVARVLNEAGFATLLCDLLTVEEDRDRAKRFDIPLLAGRVEAAIDWATSDEALRALPIGLFGASTGAAAALIAAARRPVVRAVVSRGGRPDLAPPDVLARVTVPTLLIVGGDDTDVLMLNRHALTRMSGNARLTVVPGATHLFEEPGSLERVAALAAHWFDAERANAAFPPPLTSRRGAA